MSDNKTTSEGGAAWLRLATLSFTLFCDAKAKVQASKYRLIVLFIKGKIKVLTIMIHAKVKKEMLNEYLDLIKLLVRETTKKGCLTYSFNQNKEESTEFVLYEQWESQADLDNHIKELFKILGPANPGDPIPKKLMNMYEDVTPVSYNIIEQYV